MTLSPPLRTVFIFIALACASCTETSDPTPPPEPAAAVANQFTLESAGRAKLDQVLGSLSGNVVLVDFWATSCVPCVEKLPAILALHQKFHDQGLRVVTVSLDDPDAIADIRAFLQQRGALGDHLISQFGSSPKSLEEFEIDLIPCYRLYNRAGEPVESFVPGPDAPPVELSTIEAAIARELSGG